MINPSTEMITVPRADYDALVQRLNDLEDHTLIEERRGEPTLSEAAIERMLDGESLVTLWREERRLTQRELAAQSGLSPSTINEIEKGKKAPSLTAARAIANALGLSLNDLFE
jgi:DNA-binding XRE family transcriptional regulator